MLTVLYFNQKTAYDMRISDCSSDVCSSDLVSLLGMADRRSAAAVAVCCLPLESFHPSESHEGTGEAGLQPVLYLLHLADDQRSEESRVGKEDDSTCRSRWSHYQ